MAATLPPNQLPGFRLMSGDDWNQMEAYIQAVVAGTVAGIYTGTFDGVLGGTAPAAASVTTLLASGLVTLSAGLKGNAVNAITAFAGGGQASATALTGLINNVTVVATAADSVKLPASAAGLMVLVTNSDAADSMQVFGAGTDTINDVATATGVAQAAGKTALYICPVAGKWYRLLSA